MGENHQKKISTFLGELERRTPTQTAESWDNVGLLVGDPSWKTKGAVVSVDLSPEALKVAKEKGFNLIVNHHPCIFPSHNGLSRVTPAKAEELPTLIFEAIQSQIAVMASHTNFDRCSLEVVEKITSGLDVNPLGRLIERTSPKSPASLMKLVVFVPKSDVEKVRIALGNAGAGQIGNYDSCSFGVEGLGSFRGLDGSNPSVGESGKLEFVDEVRLETLVPRGLLGGVLQAMQKAHPYEEVAYDLFEVRQEPNGKGQIKGLGYGFWGDFKDNPSFPEFTSRVKNLFELDSIRITGRPPKSVKRIGFVAGKGVAFMRSAYKYGCDVFITGEADYHDALWAARKGMVLMELGHRESEKFYLKVMQEWVKEFGLDAVIVDQATQFYIGNDPGGKQ